MSWLRPLVTVVLSSLLIVVAVGAVVLVIRATDDGILAPESSRVAVEQTESETEPETGASAESAAAIESAPVDPNTGALIAFSEDFTTGDWESRFETGIFHRDDVIIARESWFGDHASTGPDDRCSAPSETRTITRGERASGFNDDWAYRCVPGGDLELAHVMTSIGDTSGYSIGTLSPVIEFENVREIQWDVNITDLGSRQFTEAKLIPVENFDTNNIPCAVEFLPCDTDSYGDLDAVGVSFFGQLLRINNGESSTFEPYDDPDDPALESVVTRRSHTFTDDGNGTLTFSIERQDGSFQSVSMPGAFPEGPVRVVFSDHNYTPEKESEPIGFTWHWDDLAVLERDIP